MKQLKSWFASRKVRMLSAAMMIASVLCVGAGAVDESSTSASVVSALTGAAQQMVTDCMTMLAALLPIVLPLLGIGILIAYGVKYIKSITKKA